MPTFKTTVWQAQDMNATGLAVPESVVEKLASGKRPKVRVTVNGYTYRSTVAVMGDSSGCHSRRSTAQKPVWRVATWSP